MPKQFLTERFIGACSKQRFLVEKRKDSERVFVDEVDARLIVKVFYGFPSDAFASVFFLFSFQSEFDEDLLEFFVDIVDAQLFKTIWAENFKPIYIQDTDHKACIFHLNALIDVQNKPIEQTTIQAFGQGLARRLCLFFGERNRIRTVAARRGTNCSRKQSLGQYFRLAAKELSDQTHTIRIPNGRFVF